MDVFPFQLLPREVEIIIEINLILNTWMALQLQLTFNSTYTVLHYREVNWMRNIKLIYKI